MSKLLESLDIKLGDADIPISGRWFISSDDFIQNLIHRSPQKTFTDRFLINIYYPYYNFFIGAHEEEALTEEYYYGYLLDADYVIHSKHNKEDIELITKILDGDKHELP